MDRNSPGAVPRRRWTHPSVLLSRGLTVAQGARATGDGTPRLPNSQAWQTLVALYHGNLRFAAGLEERQLGCWPPGQLPEAAVQPLAAILACSDLSLPLEVLFDSPPGALYSVQTPAQVATPGAVASLEHAVGELEVKVLFVLGHLACAAVRSEQATHEVRLSGGARFGGRVAMRLPRGWSDQIFAQVRGQAQEIVRASPCVADRQRRGELLVAGGVFDPSTGLVIPVELGL